MKGCHNTGRKSMQHIKKEKGLLVLKKCVIKVKALSTADIKELCLHPANIMTVQISRNHLAIVFYLTVKHYISNPSLSKRHQSHVKVQG